MLKWVFAISLLIWATPGQAAAMFWSPNVTAGGGGSCNDGTFAWDADSGNTGLAHKCWATSTGGATAAAVPGAGDTATFDAASGGGTVVVSVPNNATGAAQVSLAGLTTGAFTGTLNFNTNNNNVTIAATAAGFNNSGTGTRVINVGSGTWTINVTGTSITAWNWGTLTNCTCTASASSIIITNASQSPGTTISGSAPSGGYGTLTLAGKNGVSVSGGSTYATINVTAPTTVAFQTGTTTTITNDFTWTGTTTNQIMVYGTSGTVAGTVAVGAGSGTSTCTYCIVRGITFSGAGVTFTGTTSFDMGLNSGMTFTAPTLGGAGSGGYIIGG